MRLLNHDRSINHLEKTVDKTLICQVVMITSLKIGEKIVRLTLTESFGRSMKCKKRVDVLVVILPKKFNFIIARQDHSVLKSKLLKVAKRDFLGENSPTDVRKVCNQMQFSNFPQLFFSKNGFSAKVLIHASLAMQLSKLQFVVV